MNANFRFLARVHKVGGMYLLAAGIPLFCGAVLLVLELLTRGVLMEPKLASTIITLLVVGIALIFIPGPAVIGSRWSLQQRSMPTELIDYIAYSNRLKQLLKSDDVPVDDVWFIGRAFSSFKTGEFANELVRFGGNGLRSALNRSEVLHLLRSDFGVDEIEISTSMNFKKHVALAKRQASFHTLSAGKMTIYVSDEYSERWKNFAIVKEACSVFIWAGIQTGRQYDVYSPDLDQTRVLIEGARPEGILQPPADFAPRHSDAGSRELKTAAWWLDRKITALAAQVLVPPEVWAKLNQLHRNYSDEELVLYAEEVGKKYMLPAQAVHQVMVYRRLNLSYPERSYDDLGEDQQRG